jgi:hypothetical protein
MPFIQEIEIGFGVTAADYSFALPSRQDRVLWRIVLFVRREKVVQGFADLRNPMLRIDSIFPTGNT